MLAMVANDDEGYLNARAVPTNVQAMQSSRQGALSLATIASRLAPTGIG
ncbi:hypothetical protein HFK74_31500|nr:hypothetical protein [Pseudomonas sp. SbOxS1]NYU07238.1 hypothetical protein [Pseudomonas sp. SbOxS1]